MDINKDKLTLSGNQLTILDSEMGKAKRSTGVAYFLLILLSPFGAHQFYLGNFLRGVIYLITLGVSFFGVFIGFGLQALVGALNSTGSNIVGISTLAAIVAGLLGVVMWLYDLFTLPSQVDRANETIEAEIITQIKLKSTIDKTAA
ncbi:MAG: TM2 domain-containing protein [Bdellovibrionota bacterium]